MNLAHSVAPRLHVTPGMGTPLWRPDLATGIREVDLQHEALLANLSALREAARTGDLGLAEALASRSMAFLLVGPMAAPARRRGGP